MKGLFFAFEGIDGSGKTTQAALLAKRLRQEGYAVVETKEPTDRPIGKLLRHSLQRDFPMNEASNALLFAADRMDHLIGPEGILSHLEQGAIVICDRYILSSLTYNSLKLPLEWILAINQEAFERYRPTAHLLFDLPEQEAIRRIETRALEKERYETLHQLRKVRLLYHSLADTLIQENILRIDAQASEHTVAERVWQAVLPYLKDCVQSTAH